MGREEHPWNLPGSSLGAFVNGCREVGDSFPSFFCLCLKQTFHLVLKIIESNNLFVSLYLSLPLGEINENEEQENLTYIQSAFTYISSILMPQFCGTSKLILFPVFYR